VDGGQQPLAAVRDGDQCGLVGQQPSRTAASPDAAAEPMR
jgi:hypothetical protein